MYINRSSVIVILNALLLARETILIGGWMRDNGRLCKDALILSLGIRFPLLKLTSVYIAWVAISQNSNGWDMCSFLLLQDQVLVVVVASL